MKNDKQIWLAVLVASLGYFVDIYDLILFSIVRIPSLKELGLEGQELMDQGLLLLNLQMAGMLLGGVVFGVMGDRLGRLSVLFGSIILYSVANFLNAFVETTFSYAILRFIAGVGLAGELGAGITLVAEILPKSKRGWGTTIVASVGICGALLAWYISDLYNWRTAYKVGGVMGFMLLFLRVGVLESGLFEKVKNHATAQKGNFFSLFKTKERFIRYAACIAIGVPVWYVVGILITLSPEFTSQLGIASEIVAGKAVFYCYAGLACGDLLSGILSQILKSRKKSILAFLLLTSVCIIMFFSLRKLTSSEFYALCFMLGIGSGYWAMFVTVAAEQFGTNIRATVATSVPNFVRGSLVALSTIFASLKPIVGIGSSGVITGIIAMSVAFLGYTILKESFHNDLDFLEH